MEIVDQFGPYRIVRRIAIGGMAEIYLAKTAGLAGFERHLVLKVIHTKFATDPEFIDMLVREAKLVVRLSHVNVAQVFDLGKEEDRYYIAMEYVEGLDLYQFLKRLRSKKQPMPLAVAAYIVSEVAAALHYAHERKDENGVPLGIIHRDISPQNVLLSYEGDVKVIDFGIAKARAHAQTTGVGIIKGKFSYMSPEQARGEKLDHRSDIFAVGVLLYELLTNKMLYDSDSARDILRLAKHGRFLPPSTHRDDIPHDLERIVLKALARETDTRYQNGNEVREALTDWLVKHSPGFGRHKLERFVRTTCQIDEAHAVTLLDKEDYDPKKSVIFDAKKKAANDRSARPLTRQISTGKKRVSSRKPPPIPRPPKPVGVARKKPEPGLFTRQVKSSTETREDTPISETVVVDDDRTVDLYSAPTAIVHLPSVPTYDVYTGPLDITDPGIEDRNVPDSGAVEAAEVYAQVRQAVADKRRSVEAAADDAETPFEQPVATEDITETNPNKAAWRVGHGVSGRPREKNASIPPNVIRVPVAPPDPDPMLLAEPDTEPTPLPAELRERSKKTTANKRSQVRTFLPLVLLVLAAIGVGTLVLFYVFNPNPPAVEPGTIFVRSEPVSGAEIFLDGTATGGVTPARISGLEGNSFHEIGVRHPDYESESTTTVRVKPGGETEVTIELYPEP